MLKIIRNGHIKKPKVYRFNCKDCDCVWETDEVRMEYERCSAIPISECPYCGCKYVIAMKG